jgi:DNA-binding response OmpR family regulator
MKASVRRAPPQQAPLRVLVIPADPARRDAPDGACTLLRELGHQVTVAPSDEPEGGGGWRGKTPPEIDVAVVDLDARGQIAHVSSAVAWLREEPSWANVRVLACVPVSAVTGLDPGSGIDDFILVPLERAELRVRLEQLLARDSQSASHRTVTYEDVTLDLEMRQASFGPRSLGLTPSEFHLLRYLVERQGRVVGRQELLIRIWGYRYVGRERSVDTHVLNLRSKLGPLGGRLESVRGLGYKLQRAGGGAR